MGFSLILYILNFVAGFVMGRLGLFFGAGTWDILGLFLSFFFGLFPVTFLVSGSFMYYLFLVVFFGLPVEHRKGNSLTIITY
ncbi:hypothetical protein QBC37DRAFT_427344 [Rhypophila decipiens]|uniref:Uncharacterized protein n=1 Tax=Rhypophila decipiens TaxID=261697 RepID=A0AAN6Y6W4_9PEZI|nr:hypothetical protein QBC37DRAFT_427344 [Rhypophila decipiens]